MIYLSSPVRFIGREAEQFYKGQRVLKSAYFRIYLFSDVIVYLFSMLKIH